MKSLYENLILASSLALAANATSGALDGTQYRFNPRNTYSDTVSMQTEGVARLVDGAYTVRWQTNLPLFVDTTAAGIEANDVLAPAVAVSVPKGGIPAAIEGLSIIGGDALSSALTFDLLICRAPITWPVTNAVANLALAELQTNLVTVIRSTDGSWGTTGGTNCSWVLSSKFAPLPVQAATNTFFMYAVNTGAITNTNSMRINLTMRQ